MKKVRLFITKENYEVDEQIDDFIAKESVDLIDVKLNTFLDTTHDIIMTSVMMIYIEG